MNKRCSASLFALSLACSGNNPPTKSSENKALVATKLVATSQPVISSPLVIDLDHDGANEIAFGSWDGYFRVISPDGSMKPGWPFYQEKGFFGSPSAADFDGDGKQEIVIGADTGELYVFSSDGKIRAGWPKKIGETIWSSPTIISRCIAPSLVIPAEAGIHPDPATNDKDSCNEQELLIAIASDYQAYLFRPDGSAAPGWPQQIENWADATMAYQDGTLVLTTLTRWKESRGHVYAWRLDGSSLPGFPVEIPTDIDSSPTLFDLDRDGSFEILFGDDAGLIHAIQSKDGREALGWPYQTRDTVESSISVADLDGDGAVEFVIGSWDHRLYVLHTRGQAVKGFPFEARDQIIAQAALVDLDQDQKIELIVGAKDGFLYGLRHDGSSADGFPVKLGGPSFSSPWVGDLNNDGKLSIIVGASDGLYIVRDAGVVGARPWPMFRGEPWHRGVVQEF